MLMVAACAAVNRDPDLIPKNEKSPLDHLGPIRAGINGLQISVRDFWGCLTVSPQ